MQNQTGVRVQTMVLIPQVRYERMVASYEEAMRELQELKEVIRQLKEERR